MLSYVTAGAVLELIFGIRFRFRLRLWLDNLHPINRQTLLCLVHDNLLMDLIHSFPL